MRAYQVSVRNASLYSERRDYTVLAGDAATACKRAIAHVRSDKALKADERAGWRVTVLEELNDIAA